MKLHPAKVLKICSVSLLALGGVTAVASIALPGAAMAKSGGNGSDHGQSGSDHGQSASDHGQSGSSHGQSGSSHGQSASHGSSNSSQGQSSGNRSINSELKGLNSARANAMALKNAAPNSQVGRNALYKEAALTTIDKKHALDDAQAAYDAFAPTYTGPTAAEIQAQIDTADATNADIQKQIDALDPTSPTYDADKADLESQLVDTTSLETQLQTAQAYETQLATLTQQLADAQDAYDTALGNEQVALDTATGGRTLSDDVLAKYRSLLGL